ncbi:S-layer homology domain-containing protein [Paenibacillus tianjinensis]|uniref:S-layer homology domain-containing protein n=1 Tax=Paenibacillus tianjinensis TaxID=2810347 RepID=A0ABX7LHL4_9BACL|nr:S-layer homology domain-containing protein [Paenibacillus tianjinensis]QSF46363.1 S-layer homology domain-containing protein [Paenibacillus tianjinensis]
MRKKRFLSAVLSIVTTVSLSLGSFAGAGVVSAQSDSSAYGEVLVSDTSNSSWTIAPGNTSRNLAVSPDGSIYAVYNGDGEIRVAKSSDNGKTFQPSVLAAAGSYEPEIAVSSSGTVYVVGVNAGSGVLVKSTDGGKTFSAPITVGALFGGSAHMAVDGSYIYVTDPSGSILYYSSNEGTTFNNYDFSESYVFTDLHVDPQTGNLIVQKDNPSLKYYVSKNHGQTMETPVIPGKSVFYSVGALSAGSQGQYLFVAGSGSNMVRMNIGDGTATDLMGGDNMSSQGRSLSADSYGNVVTGFSDGSSVFFSVSQDLGATLSSPVEVATTSIANAAINTTNGDILYLYEKSGQIYLKVYQGLLSGYKLYLSNTNLYFNYPTQKKVSVTVTNTSDTPLKINDVLINGDFKITDNTLPPELAPGTSGIIEVQYLPQAGGTSNGALTLKVDGEPDRVVLLSGISEEAAGSSAPQAEDVTANATTDTVTVKKVPAGAEVTVYAADGVTVLGTAKNEAETSGEVTVAIPAGLKSGDVIKVSLTEPDMSESPLTDITAHNEATSAPAAADVTANATTDTVTVKKVPAGAEVTVYAADGVTVQGTAKNEAETTGEVTVPVPAGLKSGDVIKVSLTEPEKSESSLTDTTAHNEATSAPAAADMTASATSSTVTVKNVPAGGTVTVYAKDGVTELATAVNESGSPAELTIVVASGLADGQILKVGTRELGKDQSPLTEIPVAYEPTQAPAAGNLAANATTGVVTVSNVPASVTVSVYAEDGTTLLGTSFNDTGAPAEFHFDVNGLEPGQVVKISFTETNKAQSAKVEVAAVYEQSAQPQAGNVVISAIDGTLTVNQVPAGAVVSIYSKEGKLLASVTNTGEAAGPLTFTGLALTEGDTLTVTLTEKLKTESAPLSVTVAIKSADVVNEASKALQIGYAAGETWENVLTSLSLPTTGGFGTQVSWTSSKPQVVEIPAATDGSINAIVHRGAEDEAVVLSATVSRDGEAKTRTFLVVVTASGAIKVEDTSNIRNVKVKDQSDNTALVPVKRINVTSADGTSSKIDKVVFDSAKAQEIVTASESGHNNSSTIYIDELPGDAADEIAVEIPATTLALLGVNSFNLNIQSDYSTISLDAATLQSMMADNLDLYFRIVPARNAEESKNQVPSSYNNQNLKALSPPLDIETNYTGYNTQLMLPFAKNGVNVSTMNASRLAVYIVHSDGTIELSKGTVVNNDKNEPYGISFDISKFSSFSIVETIAYVPGSIVTGPSTPTIPASPVVVPNDTTTATDTVYSHAAYIKGYEDGTFKPDRALTRAELAALLARNLGTEAVASGVVFTDVSSKHWAAADIAKVSAAALMKGDPDGSFNPERAVTRAEMAVLSARLKQLSFDESSAAVSAIADVNKHWAAGAIDAVKAAGLMTGFADGSFAPAKSLTRAEAVTVINRLFGRGPLSGVTRSSFSDVPVTHWAFADIEEASLNHKYTVQSGKEVIAD